MTLILKLLVTDLIRPHSGADSMLNSRHSPQLRCSRIFPVTGKKCFFETSILLPLLDGKSSEVTDRRSPFELSEINDLDGAAADQPVPGLPIAVGGDNGDRLRVMAKKQGPQTFLVGWLDSMRLIKPGN